MLHATLELARRIDRAEIDFCAMAGGAGTPGGVESLEVAGGRALCSEKGSPLNKVLALGLGAAVADQDLDAIEAFYDERGIPVQIELCPLAAAGVSARLSQRGYRLQGFENQLVRRLGRDDRFDAPPGLEVTPVTGSDLDDIWLRVVAAGFAAVDGSAPAVAPPPQDLLDQVTHTMRSFFHRDLERFLVWLDGTPAGTAAAYVMDGVYGITGISTLPEFRRRGVQQAAVAQVLNAAAGRAELAMATTEPGSISQRNFERVGFQVMYTRAVFMLE